MSAQFRLSYKLAAILSVVFLLSACATTKTTQTNQTGDYEQQITKLEQEQQALDAQKAALEQQKRDLAERAGMVDEQADALKKQQMAAQNMPATGIDGALLPPAAKAGECYARVFVPPVYKTETETVLKKGASERIEVIPATYKMEEKQMLVKEASSRMRVIPAVYDTVTETVMVKDRELMWRTSLDKNAPLAAQTLLDTAAKYGIDLDAATPGMCFHEHYLPATYETVYDNEMVSEESYRIEVIPASYETVEERILVSEATTRLVTIPATYKWEEEKILVREAYVDWKKGRGLIEKIDNTTGEIMCRVEIPAEYKIVKKKIVDQPARTVEEVIPAVYKTVKVQKMVAPASEQKIAIPAQFKQVAHQKVDEQGRLVWHEINNNELTKKTRTGNQICLVETPAEYRKTSKQVVVTSAKTVVEEIPAVYETVKVKVVENAAQERKIEIPAEYQTVSYEKKVAEGHLEWRQVLCETNTTSNVIAKLQAALAGADYNPGPVDGVYGRQTAAAVSTFQKDEGLATGGLTLETLKKLGL